MNDTQLIAAAVVGISLLLFLIIRVKLHAFVALLVGSLVIGLGAGMPVQGVLDSITAGMGGTLGSIAAVIGLGAMFGRMLEISGGAKALANSLIEKFGERNAQWSLMVIGLIVAVPVFFDVAFIILISIVFGLTKRTGRPIVFYALPLVAGLGVAHTSIPPTPGPIAVAELLDADLGWVMLFGFLIGIPAAVLAGPVWAKFISRHVTSGVPEYMDAEEKTVLSRMPSVGLIIALIVLPLFLIVSNTIASATLAEGNMLGTILAFVGHPMVALLFSTVLCFYVLGVRSGFTRQEIQDVATGALEPAGIVILVTGAGGVLKQVLIDSGVGDVIANGLLATNMSPILLAFAISAAVRMMQGSATVAMLTAGGLVSALLVDVQFSDPMLALMVIAIAAGAISMSHVNDSGFWLINRYLGLSVTDTLKTWTVTSTIIGLVTITLACVLSLFLS